MDLALPLSGLSFLLSYGDNSYLMDHNKRTRVKEFCNLQVLFSCGDLAQETLRSPSATFLPQQLSSC
uniref:Alternative protein TMEM234 n=1 Tax=Homo sapiens TaxID=9606 RepID=L8E8X9_HUMAN|nr:alternative protein TMEM234 [Homo sapiens]